MPTKRKSKRAKEVGAPVIELHAALMPMPPRRLNGCSNWHELKTAPISVANRARWVNAGHGLTIHNVEPGGKILAIHELNIGHSLMAQAPFLGLPEAIRQMKDVMFRARALPSEPYRVEREGRLKTNKINRKGESMIYGIGTDIVDVKRIEKLYKKYGRYPERILSPLEMHDWQGIGRPVKVLAKRFAAKEAFAQAVGGHRHTRTGHFSRQSASATTNRANPNFICSPRVCRNGSIKKASGMCIDDLTIEYGGGFCGG